MLEENIKKIAYANARRIVKERNLNENVITKLAYKLIPKIRLAEEKRLSSINSLFEDKIKSKKESSKKTKDIKQPKKPHIIMHDSFGEELENNSLIYTNIVNKAEKSGIDIEILGEVYNRGYNSWTESSNITQQQYAFARMNSFINKGKTYFNEDADLIENEQLDELSPETLNRYTTAAGRQRHNIFMKGGSRSIVKKRETGLRLANKKLKSSVDEENLDELSRRSLRSYKKEAEIDKRFRDTITNALSDSDDKDDIKVASSNAGISAKRKRGLDLVNKKLTSEELDTQVDKIKKLNLKTRLQNRNNKEKLEKAKVSVKEDVDADEGSKWTSGKIVKKYQNHKGVKYHLYHDAENKLGSIHVLTRPDGTMLDHWRGNTTKEVHNKLLHQLLPLKEDVDNKPDRLLHHGVVLEKGTSDNKMYKHVKFSILHPNRPGVTQPDGIGHNQLHRFAVAKMQDDHPTIKGLVKDGWRVEAGTSSLHKKNILDFLDDHKKRVLVHHKKYNLQEEIDLDEDTLNEGAFNVGFKYPGHMSIQDIQNHIRSNAGHSSDHYSPEYQLSKIEVKHVQSDKTSPHEIENDHLDKAEKWGPLLAHKHTDGHWHVHGWLAEEVLDEAREITPELRAAQQNLKNLKSGVKPESDKQPSYKQMKTDRENAIKAKFNEHKKMYNHHKDELKNIKDTRHDLKSGNLGIPVHDKAWQRGAEEELDGQEDHHNSRMNHHLNHMYHYNNKLERPYQIKEDYESDQKDFDSNADSIQKEHNKKSDYHFNKAKEHSNASTLNGTLKDYSHLKKADAHRRASRLHSDAAGAIVMRHHSAFYKSKEANKASDFLNESYKDTHTGGTSNAILTKYDASKEKYLKHHKAAMNIKQHLLSGMHIEKAFDKEKTPEHLKSLYRHGAMTGTGTHHFITNVAKLKEETLDELSYKKVDDYFTKAARARGKAEMEDDKDTMRRRDRGLKIAVRKQPETVKESSYIDYKADAEKYKKDGDIDLFHRAMERHHQSEAMKSRNIGNHKEAEDHENQADFHYYSYKNLKEQSSSDDIKEAVKSADKQTVIVPSYTDQYGNTIPAKAVLRKSGRLIIKNGNVNDGKSDQ